MLLGEHLQQVVALNREGMLGGARLMVMYMYVLGDARLEVMYVLGGAIG